MNIRQNKGHVYDYLKCFPIWNNYPFESWKPDFNADEKLLPVAKLSIMVSLVDASEVALAVCYNFVYLLPTL